MPKKNITGLMDIVVDGRYYGTIDVSSGIREAKERIYADFPKLRGQDYELVEYPYYDKDSDSEKPKGFQ